MRERAGRKNKEEEEEEEEEEGREMMQAVLLGEAGLNYGSGPHQSSGRPVASLAPLVTDWELDDELLFVHTITLTD